MVVSQILCFDHSLFLISSSWSCTWFLGRRWGFAPCALEMYGKQSNLVGLVLIEFINLGILEDNIFCHVFSSVI